MTDKNFKIGDTVWFKEKWSGTPFCGKITQFVTEQCEPWAAINGVGELEGEFHVGTTGARVKNLYRTKEELLTAMKNESEKQINEYKAKLNTPEDFIRFMYDNVVCAAEEYTDWNARCAVREKAKELFGIKLEE